MGVHAKVGKHSIMAIDHCYGEQSRQDVARLTTLSGARTLEIMMIFVMEHATIGVTADVVAMMANAWTKKVIEATMGSVGLDAGKTNYAS